MTSTIALSHWILTITLQAGTEAFKLFGKVTIKTITFAENPVYRKHTHTSEKVAYIYSMWHILFNSMLLYSLLVHLKHNLLWATIWLLWIIIQLSSCYSPFIEEERVGGYRQMWRSPARQSKSWNWTNGFSDVRALTMMPCCLSRCSSEDGCFTTASSPITLQRPFTSTHLPVAQWFSILAACWSHWSHCPEDENCTDLDWGLRRGTLYFFIPTYFYF